MITLCSVMLKSIAHYEEIFIKSILQHTKLVSEVVLAQNDSFEGSLNEEWTERGINFRRIGSKPIEATFSSCGDQHGYGLNFAIDKAKNDYVYLCDPDIFFYSAVDELFYNLMKNYNLQAVGCSHHSATEISQTFFPWHGNVLMRKDTLPGIDWMPEIHSIPGKFLMAGLGNMAGIREQYPNPNGNFDTSSGLWLWAHQQDWTWLSFQTTAVHKYDTKFYRTNKPAQLGQDFRRKLPKQNLIYHGVSGSIEKEKWEPFKASYEESMIEKKEGDD